MIVMGNSSLEAISVVQLRDENIPSSLPLILFDTVGFLFTKKELDFGLVFYHFYL